TPPAWARARSPAPNIWTACRTRCTNRSRSDTSSRESETPTLRAARSIGTRGNRLAVRVDTGSIERLGQALLQFGPQIVLDSFGRRVQMIERQIEMLAQIKLPESMRADQRLRRRVPFGGQHNAGLTTTNFAPCPKPHERQLRS